MFNGDCLDEGEVPVEFPQYPTGEAATAFLSHLVLNAGDRVIKGDFLDGPTGVGAGANEIFNGTDVIPPKSWWNTTFRVKYDPPLEPPWVLVYRANLEYRDQNGTTTWSWAYGLPCYNVDGTVNTTFGPDMCGSIHVLN